MSVAMARIAADDGIEVIIATPHVDAGHVTPERLHYGVQDLNRELITRRIPLTVVPGFEIPHCLALTLAPSHGLAGSRYVLVEFPHDYLPADAPAILSRLVDGGFLPVIAHPERNRDILINPGLLADMIATGALAQITAGSVTGEMGPDCQRCAIYLLSLGLVHFIATDSHSPSFRTPELSKARSLTRKLLGVTQAELLTNGNPWKIFQSASKTSGN